MVKVREFNLGPVELQKHILSTYLSLRIGIAAIGMAFPLILAVGGYFYAGLCLQGSMSAYYHAVGPSGRTMRDWFVGILFAVGVFLYLYKGFSRIEDYLLNVAGVFSIGIAIFPMDWSACQLIACEVSGQIPCSGGGSKEWISLHGFCAITFFLCIASVCLFCADDTLPLIQSNDVRERLRKAYRLIGGLMIGSMALAYVFNTVLHNTARTFYVEAFGILSFAAYWWTKSWELGQTAAESRAIRGRLANVKGRVMDATLEKQPTAY
jgi:hypothetical protein